MVFTIAIYEIDRAWGGNEDGGWWFDCGTFERIVRIVPTEEVAIAICQRINALLGRLQRGHRSVSSVLYTGGRYAASAYPGLPPAHYPNERPTWS
jgi:hypothetical protein